MKKILLSTISLIYFATTASYGQGCSDAGFCTINSFKPNKASDSVRMQKNQIKVGAFTGASDLDITVQGMYLEYNSVLNKKWSADAKLTSLGQSGYGIATFGLGDLFLSTNYRINKKAGLTIGAKLPLSNAGKSLNNLPLPMDFQSSLGTVDLIVGGSYQLKRFHFVLGLQQAFTQNKNQFDNSLYASTHPFRNIASTNKFKRSGDVLLRASYPFYIKKKLIITPSLLPIYHLANDKYTNASGVKEIVGSGGLTFNTNLYLDYTLNKKSGLQLILGMPLVVRDARPDGLTRAFIANLEYRRRF